MKKSHKIILFLCVILYSFNFTLYLIYETPKPSSTSRLTDYFSAEKIAIGKQYFNQRVIISLSAFFIKIGLLFWLYKSKKWEKITDYFIRKIKKSFFCHLLYTFTLSFFVFGLLLLPLNLISYFHLISYKIIITPFFLFVKDFFISVSIFSLGASIIAAVGIRLYQYKQKLFPYLATLFVLIFAFFLMVIYPIFITPLFNDFSRLNHPELENKINALFHERGMKIKNLYVVNASRRTLGANAYVSGLGPTKEIVLYDTLLKDYNIDEIVNIVAHELGHYEKHHIIVGIFTMPLSNPFAILAFFLFLTWVIKKNEKEEQSLINQIPFILFIVLIAFQLSMPLTNAISRRMERDADYFSLSITKNPSAFISSQVKLSSKHYYTNYDPNSFFKMLYYSHPSVKERIEMALGKQRILHGERQ